jgi:hypothetical protein
VRLEIFGLLIYNLPYHLPPMCAAVDLHRFQIIDHRYLFRNKETGMIQWQHPDPNFHTDKYEVPPKDDGIVLKYETVSYVWGDPQKPAIITVDGPEGPAKLCVTQSLITALRYLRYLEKP